MYNIIIHNLSTITEVLDELMEECFLLTTEQYNQVATVIASVKQHQEISLSQFIIKDEGLSDLQKKIIKRYVSVEFSDEAHLEDHEYFEDEKQIQDVPAKTAANVESLNSIENQNRSNLLDSSSVNSKPQVQELELFQLKKVFKRTVEQPKHCMVTRFKASKMKVAHVPEVGFRHTPKRVPLLNKH